MSRGEAEVPVMARPSSSALAAAGSALLVSRRQRQNPALRELRNVHWRECEDLVPDFLVGSTSAALFLSLRYHLQKPQYIHARMRALQSAFRLRTLLCLVDSEDVERGIRELNHACTLNSFTLICAWSFSETARYLETLKAYESKPADLIQERVEQDYISQLTNCLSAVQGLNRVDSSALGSRFGSLAGVLRAQHQTLTTTPGIGPTKALRLHKAFHVPFKGKRPASRQAQRDEPQQQPQKGDQSRNREAIPSERPSALERRQSLGDDDPNGADEME
jgi:DNA excision repair protein ERCC-1